MGIKAINPFNNRAVPVFVADYVLVSYGTGAVMGVPGHDARDYEFAKKYKLPIISVIKPTKQIKEKVTVNNDGFWNYMEIEKNTNNAVLFNSKEFNGLNSRVAKSKFEKELIKKGWGEKAVSYHLRDWVFSRQHYWGEPIPIIYCHKCLEISNFKFQISK